MVDPVAGPFMAYQWGVILTNRGVLVTKVAKHLGIVANEIEEMSERPPGIPTQEIDWDFRGG